MRTAQFSAYHNCKLRNSSVKLAPGNNTGSCADLREVILQQKNLCNGSVFSEHQEMVQEIFRMAKLKLLKRTLKHAFMTVDENCGRQAQALNRLEYFAGSQIGVSERGSRCNWTISRAIIGPDISNREASQGLNFGLANAIVGRGSLLLLLMTYLFPNSVNWKANFS